MSRELMGLAYDEGLLPVAPSGEEVDDNVKRRALLALASVALFDRPVLGELLGLPTSTRWRP